MKLGDARAEADAQTEAGCDADRRTRARVRREVLQRGPVSAAGLAQALQVSPAAIRRHLDALLEEGLVAVWTAPVSTRRSRGRPARQFVVTDSGHGDMTSEYDDLAVAALAFVAEQLGEQGVRGFAERRAAVMEARYRERVENVGPGSRRRAEALATALTGDGYASSTRPLMVGSMSVGTQLCQGHCPVQHVAARFPQLCEAETEAFSRLLGVHVQRLATLAHGEHVCTTHVPNHRRSVPVVPRTTAPPGTTAPLSTPTVRGTSAVPSHPSVPISPLAPSAPSESQERTPR